MDLGYLISTQEGESLALAEVNSLAVNQNSPGAVVLSGLLLRASAGYEQDAA
jgi:hypothetical protein